MSGSTARPSASSAGRLALVTGAAGGLGTAVCEALAAHGLRVVAADLDAQGLAALTQQGDGEAAVSVAPLDVTRRQDVDALVRSLGRVDVAVNLAGVLRNQLVAKIDDDDFALVMRTHLGGTLNVMRAALPGMRANRYGRIVNMSSLAARGSIAGGAYGAAKGAIEGLTRSAAMECARDGVTVNCVAPGLIAAGMFLMGRPGDAAEVAAAVSFLASSEASYVTGQTLRVCGGLSLGY
jgi:3-oxoacyl-[acyl-carrier protein] reductase